jgi:hypothetical protein
MNSPKVIRKTRQQKIDQLIQIVNEGHGESASGVRLTHTERRFFLKHPDWVHDVLSGTRSHVRANAIARKMKSYHLGVEDVGTIHERLAQRKAAKAAG